MAAPSFHLQNLFAVYPPDVAMFPYLWMYHYAFWAIVVVMGIGYWMAARTPNDNRVVLFLGGAGKLACASVWLYLFGNGHGNWLMLSGTFYDGILGILFIMLFIAQPRIKA